MEKQPLVSIIVPIYNVEDYLEECLNSIRSQSFNNLEIILIDDGSIDKSFSIMEKYAIIDKRVRLCRQNNKGVSAARNKGISLSTGKYILFVDSDDTISSNTVKTMLTNALENQSEIVIGNALVCYPNGEKKILFPRNDKLKSIKRIHGNICYSELVETNSFPPLVYLFFIRREYIINNQLYFQEGIVHEDELWTAKTMLLASNITLIDFNYYFYRQRPGSITNSFDNLQYRTKCYFIVVNELIKFANQKTTIISKESIGWMYVMIFMIYQRMTHLEKREEHLRIYNDFFSELLINMYSKLSYKQQLLCKHYYCYANFK